VQGISLKKQKNNFFRQYAFYSILSGWLFVFAGLMLSTLSLRKLHDVLVTQTQTTPPLVDQALKRQRDRLLPVFFGVVSISVTVSFLISLFWLRRYFRQKGTVAKEVMQELQNGKLSSRFPIERIDESSHLMSTFNDMASEVERLFHKVESEAAARRNVIQELSHDFKTPLSAMRITLDNLTKKNQLLTEEEKAEYQLALSNEVVYLSELLDSLLFLATVDDPYFKTPKEEIDLVAFLNEEIQAALFPQGKKLALEIASGVKISVNADRKVLKRALRNAISNALDYAQSHVKVALIQYNNAIQLSIADDGPGMPSEILENYGIKRFNRELNNSSGRASLGLGSVIIRKTFESTGGTFYVENIRSNDSKLHGCRLITEWQR